MKKILFLSLIAITSCTEIETGPKVGKQEYEIGKAFDVGGRRFEVVLIDSCEYISSGIGHQSGLLTHKGNCKNPFHAKK